MRHPIFYTICLGGVLALSACSETNLNNDAEVDRTVAAVNVIDETNLNDIMLTVGDPNEAVAYFGRAVSENPDRADLQRGLGKSLVRAQRAREAVAVWRKVVEGPDATNDDRVELADALIRAGDWGKAEQVLDTIPPTFETFKRYRLEAMVADSNKDWKRADSFYEIAVGLTTRPANVLNNWGYSKLTRADYRGAEKLFFEALTYDPSLFTAKNNLVLARAAQRKYDMPAIRMTQVERAQLLHTAALSAIKQGDIAIGKTLLQEAIDTHPQYFEAAVRALRSLEDNVANR
ncbi:MAG TPA: tetratricopeptide repeat protein [Rhodobacteraceae bacterium]|nr:tetratricopeptide repeat protein [Paracoccaceae bacterium]